MLYYQLCQASGLTIQSCKFLNSMRPQLEIPFMFSVSLFGLHQDFLGTNDIFRWEKNVLDFGMTLSPCGGIKRGINLERKNVSCFIECMLNGLRYIGIAFSEDALSSHELYLENLTLFILLFLPPSVS
jgi:hypothetical protein